MGIAALIMAGSVFLSRLMGSGVQMGWLASQADMLADDWMFVE